MRPRREQKVATHFGYLRRRLRSLAAKLRAGKSSQAPALRGNLHGDEGMALDKLIEGESITVAGSDGCDAGYVMGWTSRKIPAQFRPILWNQAARLELETWTQILKDASRALPDELTLIFWEGLPLAVWIPPGHVTEFNFNPN